MAETLALVASVLTVAEVGLQTTTFVREFVKSVVGAEKRLKGLDKDLELSTNIISLLAQQLSSIQTQAGLLDETIALIQRTVIECHAIFEAMESIIGKIQASSSMAKLVPALYWQTPKLEELGASLTRHKMNLILLLGAMTQPSTTPAGIVTATTIELAVGHSRFQLFWIRFRSRRRT
ncbi:hypothetical protein N658DRAFT_501838 [Parathielavia hyrcaniae]|uniref:Fungal N-terminal domain-containing protein n=1 Tax=Parathielavia hyrcaniae TaxID=113614 RepID=A0AAN6SX92_9PEZI|nr:hypothetical protein N658DRAFT_501838 [Parathielavia hyrcaniae]